MPQYTLFTKRVGLAASTQIITVLRSLIILPILTKNLGASNYGIWAQVLVTISLLQPIIQLGLGNALLRFFSARGKKEIGQGVITALSVVLITGAAASIALFFSSGLLATNLLHEESAISVIRLASPLLFLEALNTIALSSFRIFGQIKRYTVVVWLRNALEIGLIAYFVLSGHGLAGAVTSLLISRGVTLAVMLCFIISYAGFSHPNFSGLRSYLAYGLPLVPTILFEFITSSSDRYVIGFLIGATAVGTYSAAYGIGSTILVFSGYIMYVLRPTIYKKYDEGKIDECKTYLSYSWKYLLMLVIPAAFGVSILAKPLLASLTTAEFVSTGRFIVPLVATGIVFYSVEQMFGAVLLLSKRSRIFASVFGIAGGVNLGLNFVLIPRFGIIGAAITTIVAYAIVAIVIYYKSRQQLRFDLNPGFIGKSVLSSVVMTLAIWAINPSGARWIILAIIAGTAVYFAMLFLLKGFKKNETQFFRKLFRDTAKGTKARITKSG